MVAVNSGTSPASVSSYAKKNRITLPIIADVDRSMEAAAMVGEISLKNIFQARILVADGTVKRGNPTKLDEAMQTAASGAAWNIDPAEIPQSMKALWQSIEFGSYAAGAKQIKRFLNSRKPDEKAAAGKLNDYIQKQLESRLAVAEGNREKEPWMAWKQFSQIAVMFKGYELPDTIEKTLAELGKNEAVTSEQAALKMLDSARKAASGSAAARKRAVRTLKKLIEKYPDTEAATNAERLLGG
ncbi:hypothetical protein OAH18_02415 [bacterium]|nr:hypothetical protein [bacterium]